MPINNTPYKLLTIIALSMASVALLVSGFALIRNSQNLTKRAASIASTQTMLPIQSLVNGIYMDNSRGKPLYFVTLTLNSKNKVEGSMDFAYQDGQTSIVFTFKGTAQQLHDGSPNGIMTLTPVLFPQNGSASQAPSSIPSSLSVFYSPKKLEFGECGYLKFVSSMSACWFSYSASNDI